MIKNLMMFFTNIAINYMELPLLVRIIFLPLYIIGMIFYTIVYYIIYFIGRIKYGKNEWKIMHYNYIQEYYQEFLKNI